MIAVLLGCYSVPEADRATVLADVDAANAMFDQANAAFEREVRRLDELRASATPCPLKAVVDAHTTPLPPIGIASDITEYFRGFQAFVPPEAPKWYPVRPTRWEFEKQLDEAEDEADLARIRTTAAAWRSAPFKKYPTVVVFAIRAYVEPDVSGKTAAGMTFIPGSMSGDAYVFEPAIGRFTCTRHVAVLGDGEAGYSFREGSGSGELAAGLAAMLSILPWKVEVDLANGPWSAIE